MEALCCPKCGSNDLDTLELAEMRLVTARLASFASSMESAQLARRRK